MKQADFGQFALRMIRRNSQPCTYIKVDEGAYDDATMTKPVTETSHLIEAYLAPTERMDYLEPAFAGKTLQTFWVAAVGSPVIPYQGDKVQSNQGSFVVMRVRSHNWSGGTAFWKVICIKS